MPKKCIWVRLCWGRHVPASLVDRFECRRHLRARTGHGRHQACHVVVVARGHMRPVDRMACSGSRNGPPARLGKRAIICVIHFDSCSFTLCEKKPRGSVSSVRLASACLFRPTPPPKKQETRKRHWPLVEGQGKKGASPGIGRGRHSFPALLFCLDRVRADRACLFFFLGLGLPSLVFSRPVKRGAPIATPHAKGA